MTAQQTARRIVLAAAGGVLGSLAVLVAIILLAALPMDILTTLALTVAGGALGAVAGWVYVGPSPALVEVSIGGAIRRDQPDLSESRPADEYVEAIEDAEEAGADGLLVTINSPGGEILPSQDIRRAIESFDGPTVALAEDQCASGGYLIASAADHVIAHRESIVGSIGVIGSRVNMADLADRLGLTYQQLTAGERKDAGHPLKDPDDEDEAYLETLIQDYYDVFVDRVSGSRPMEPQDVRDTEARVFLGEQAVDLGLVDEVGTRDDAIDHLEELLPIGEAGQLVDDDVADITPSPSPFGLGGPGGLLGRLSYGATAAIADRAGLGDDSPTSPIEVRFDP